jgi:hypothetical protein
MIDIFTEADFVSSFVTDTPSNMFEEPNHNKWKSRTEAFTKDETGSFNLNL